MTYFYSDTPERPKNFINPYKMDPNKQWLKHYGNYLFLHAVFANPKDLNDKRQANNEILRCQKKLDYWAKMPSWSLTVCENGKKSLLTQWNMTEPAKLYTDRDYLPRMKR